MFVAAISTPGFVGWHWRIVNYDGAMVEESHAAFGTIEAALLEGRIRLQEMDPRALSVPMNRPYGNRTWFPRRHR
jgi:hypothetical protein